LLISDKLFRAKNVATRKVYVSLVERAERSGVEAVIFGSMNPGGERLDNLSGVAAILRYPLPGLDDIEEDDSDENEEAYRYEENAGDENVLPKMTYDE